MGWREELRRVQFPDGRRLIGASFRGVPFLVESNDRTGGRRAVNHEFPFRDLNFIEDTGRHGRTFPVEGYVVGEDYLTQRDALIAALEDVEGPGELVHPSYGVRRAVCTRLSVRENVNDGGLARFSLEFTEAPAQAAAPTIEPDLGGLVEDSAAAAGAASDAEFQSTYNVKGLPAFALASAETAVRSMATGLGDALADVVSDTDELAKLTGQLTVILSETQSLVRQPAEVLGSFRDAIESLVQTASTAPGAMVDALLDAYDIDLGADAPETTATRVRERENQVALEGALRQLVVIEAARLAPTVAYPSIEDATAARDAVASRLAEQASTAGDTAYPALVELRANLSRAIPGDRIFASILTIERRVAVPSLLLVYQLYGAVDQEGDIIARNNIRHPGFISGTLRVLSSDG